MKNLKIKIRGFLIIKIAKLRKKIKAYEDRILEDALKEQEYIDEMNLMKDEIRQLILKLPKEERDAWLKRKEKKNERHFFKKK